jgi:hypothetical protein
MERHLASALAADDIDRVLAIVAPADDADRAELAGALAAAKRRSCYLDSLRSAFHAHATTLRPIYFS